MAWTDPPSTYATTSGEAITPSLYPTYSWCPAVTQEEGANVASIVDGIGSGTVAVATWSEEGLVFPGSAGQGFTMISGVVSLPHTVAFLWKYDSVSSTQNLWTAHKSDETAATWEIRFRNDATPNYIIAHVNTTGGLRSHVGNFTPVTGVWYTFVCRCENGVVHDLWKNGTKIVDEDSLSNLGDQIDRLFFGAYYNGANRSVGTLAGIHWWDKTLTSGEITTLTEDFWAPIRTGSVKYWLGTTTDWFADSNWSTTAGGTSDTTVPTTYDSVDFNVLGTGNCSLTGNAEISGINMSSNYLGALSYNNYTITCNGDVTYNGVRSIDGTLECQKFYVNNNLTIEEGGVVQPTSLYLLNGNIGGDGELWFVGNSGIFTINGVVVPSLTKFAHVSYPSCCPPGNYGNTLFYADSADGNVVLSGLYTFNDLTYKSASTHTLHVTGQASPYDGIMSLDRIHVGGNFTINPNGGTIDWNKQTGATYIECYASGTNRHNIVLGGVSLANIYAYYSDVWFSGADTAEIVGNNTRFKDQINTSRLSCLASGQFDSDIYCSGICLIWCQGLTMDSILYGNNNITVYSTTADEYWANAMAGSLTIVPSGSSSKTVRTISSTNYLNTSNSTVSISSVNCTDLDLYLPRKLENIIVDSDSSVNEIAAQSYNTNLSKFENNGSIENINQNFLITDDLIINGATSGSADFYFYGDNFQSTDILDINTIYNYGSVTWPTGSHHTSTYFVLGTVSLSGTYYFYENVNGGAGASYNIFDGSVLSLSDGYNIG